MLPIRPARPACCAPRADRDDCLDGRGYAYTAAYVASKHAAIGLVRAIAAEFARTGPTANAVCPGFTNSEITSRSVRRIAEQTGRSADEAAAAIERFDPQNRLVEPVELARAVPWLRQPESRAFTDLALPGAGGEA